jgi:hypothetical protein
LFIEQINQCVGKTKLCIGILAFAGDTGTPDQGIICAKNECKCVKQKKTFVHSAKVIGNAVREELFDGYSLKK